MDYNEQWIPIIYESIKWIKEKMKPTKADLKLKISELEEQIRLLSCENGVLTNNMKDILEIIIYILKSEGSYVVNADTIIQIEENYGSINVSNAKITNMDDVKALSRYYIFEGMDEEILQCRLQYPSERRNI